MSDDDDGKRVGIRIHPGWWKKVLFSGLGTDQLLMNEETYGKVIVVFVDSRPDFRAEMTRLAHEGHKHFSFELLEKGKKPRMVSDSRQACAFLG